MVRASRPRGRGMGLLAIVCLSALVGGATGEEDAEPGPGQEEEEEATQPDSAPVLGRPPSASRLKTSRVRSPPASPTGQANQSDDEDEEEESEDEEEEVAEEESPIQESSGGYCTQVAPPAPRFWRRR